MSVVTFFSNDKAETSQTTSMAAIATYLSIEQNYRILLINTKHNDKSIQECFWEQSKDMRSRTDLETGITGLIKAIASNKISPEIITNYTRTIFKEKLEVLTDGNILKEDYIKQKEYMKSIIRLANKFYDLVFVDLDKTLNEDTTKVLLETSNIIIYNFTKNLKQADEYLEFMEKFPDLLKKEKVIPLLSNSDENVVYNVKNCTRYIKEKRDIATVPYNTTYVKSLSEAGVAQFFLTTRLSGKLTDRNTMFVGCVEDACKRIIEKLKELKLKT